MAIQKIDVSKESFSTYYIRMCTNQSDVPMATGTAFAYEHHGEIFLITNGHNITSVHPETKQRLSDYAAFPTRIRIRARMKHENGTILSELFTVDLYEDKDFTKPLWYVHPDFGYRVDVVAIPLERRDSLPSHIVVMPLNDIQFDEQYVSIVADDVFILGYPLDLNGMGELPIWKRGSIASEPNVNIDGLPKFLVDTATRPGMSGSPVIMRRTGFHSSQTVEQQAKNGTLASDLIGRIQNFVGVYSGRIGSSTEFHAQLGIVWKKEVIDQILGARIIGTTEFQASIS
jgi:V8-like Glu-specific endopeptidase